LSSASAPGVRSFDPIDFVGFHERELPARLERGHAAVALAGPRPPGALAFRIAETGESFTYVFEESGPVALPGEAGASAVVELAQREWEGLVYDVESAPGLLYGGLVKGGRGDMMDFVRWEPTLRALYLGRPIYDPEMLDLRDRHGRPLDPTRAFSLDDDDEEMADFLATAGYVLIRSVFSAQEVAAMSEDAESLRSAAVEGDEKSWWAEREDGRSVVCRVIDSSDRPHLRSLHADPRIRRLGTLPRETLVPGGEAQMKGATVLWKQPGMVSGLADLPWHRDCGMGGHAVKCPSVNCSIYLGPANPEAGDLRFLPGSASCSVGFADGDDEGAPRGISIASEPGDVSLHYGDVVHAAPAPAGASGPFRTSVLIGWEPPGAAHHRGGDHYNDALFQGEDKDVPDMRTMAKRVG